MDGQATGGILRFFRDLPDPRAHNVIHKLHDIIVIAVCAVICGADGWAEVAEFGGSKQAWLLSMVVARTGQRVFFARPVAPPIATNKPAT